MIELDFPRTREAPVEVSRALQAIDPRAIALWWGPVTSHVQRADPALPWRKTVVPLIRPTWIVGFVDVGRALNVACHHRLERLDAVSLAPVRDPVSGSVETRQDFAARCYTHHMKRRLTHLQYQGFRETFFWPARDIDGGAVEAFREYDWLYRHLFELYVRNELKRLESDGSDDQDLTDRQAAIADGVRAAMPGIWRHTMRGRRSIVVPSRAA